MLPYFVSQLHGIGLPVPAGYDCFFLDWVLFANVKRIRLLGPEHMDKEYHQKKYHVVSSLIGMAVGLIPWVLAGVLVMAVR